MRDPTQCLQAVQIANGVRGMRMACACAVSSPQTMPVHRYCISCCGPDCRCARAPQGTREISAADSARRSHVGIVAETPCQASFFPHTHAVTLVRNEGLPSTRAGFICGHLGTQLRKPSFLTRRCLTIDLSLPRNGIFAGSTGRPIWSKPACFNSCAHARKEQHARNTRSTHRPGLTQNGSGLPPGVRWPSSGGAVAACGTLLTRTSAGMLSKTGPGSVVLFCAAQLPCALVFFIPTVGATGLRVQRFELSVPLPRACQQGSRL